MVGRLIECEKIIRLKYQFGHSQTRTLPSAEDSHFLVYVITSEEEGSQNIPEAGADISDSHPVEGFEYGILLIEDILLILRIISQCHIISVNGFTSQRIQLPCDYFHQSGFSFSITSHEGHFLPSFHYNVRFRQHFLFA